MKKTMKKTLLWFAVVLLTGSMISVFALSGCKEAVEEVEEAVEEVEEAVEEAVEEEAKPEEEIKYSEAPMFTEKVESGEIPSVDERLPENPLIIEPFKEIGKYGGTFSRGTGFFMPDEWLVSHIDVNSFFRFQWPFPGEGPVQPNLADKWEFNEDGTELIVHIREDIKWSDGEPFTVDDILFFLEDVLGDEDVAYTWYHISNLYDTEGNLHKADKIDDYTLKFVYSEPSFMVETGYACLPEIALPKHYLSQFHPKYNSESDYETFNKELVWSNGRGEITLNAWMLEEFLPDSKLTMVRNPYYWKVDTEGQQLPYFDKVEIYVAGDRQSVALGNVTGEYDNDAMWVGIQHLSLFLEEEPNRDFTVGHSIVSGMGIWFNMDCPDENTKKVIRDVNIRRAVSLAIDRLNIGKVMFYDMLVPMGCSFSSNSAYFEEEVGTLYSENDPEKAMQILDDAGIVDTDNDGIRELPTGEKCELIWDVYEHDLYAPISEMVVDDIKAIGINFVLNMQHQNLITERREAGEYQISTYDFMNVDEPLTAMEWWIPMQPGTPFWHNKASDEPFSNEYAEFIELLKEAKISPYEKRVELMKAANKIMAENVFAIHIGFYKRPNITASRIENLPHIATRIDEFGCDAPPFMYYQIYELYKPGEE